MGWATPRPSLPVTSWDKIRYQDMNAPARMTTGSRSADEIRPPNDWSDRDGFAQPRVRSWQGKFS